jgi:hypothetical protein
VIPFLFFQGSARIFYSKAAQESFFQGSTGSKLPMCSLAAGTAAASEILHIFESTGARWAEESVCPVSAGYFGEYF